MKRTFATIAAAAAIGLSITASHASDITSPPTVDRVPTPARQLDLGMTVDEVLRIMGEPTRTTAFGMDGRAHCKIEFAGAVPTKIILADGKLSSVKLDVFRPDKTDLPAFGRAAWPGLAESAVRHMLGVPTEIRHYNLFGINVDQWIFVRDGQADLSVFLRSGRGPGRSLSRRIAVTAEGRGPDTCAPLGDDNKRHRGALRRAALPGRLRLQRATVVARGLQGRRKGNVHRGNLRGRCRDGTRGSWNCAERPGLPRPIVLKAVTTRDEALSLTWRPHRDRRADASMYSIQVVGKAMMNPN